ncbi:DUF3159 domain-containing protein [Alicyclobacillus sp.]|uniref:DUF3159 domain-containing protein n=1 Tax=Alicyclobacillus sp. TaxID=61169 RepID=UPI0025B9CFBB|nr:DUF3159 domain-containing protein [Alicyclobacillus sp.]MCL6516491.1 DUF3159 domain-containing protein [Alicyclobacillus sp.]
MALRESEVRLDPSDGNSGGEVREHPYDERHLGQTFLHGNYRADLRAPRPQEWGRFIETGQVRDWSVLSWKDVGRPFRVENYASGKRLWEEQNGDRMPVRTSWEMFNRSFHRLFMQNVPEERSRLRQQIVERAIRFQWRGVGELLESYEQLALWNLTHRVQDAIWDPRGKRGLFEGLGLERPRILFLGAATITARTAISLVSGSTFVYFLQPSLGTALVASAFLLSVPLGNPLAGRLASDFCPLPDEVVRNEHVRLFFRRISLLWAFAYAANAALTIWLLLTQSIATFVVARVALSWTLTITAVVVSALWFRRTMARHGIHVRLPSLRPGPA